MFCCSVAGVGRGVGPRRLVRAVWPACGRRGVWSSARMPFPWALPPSTGALRADGTGALGLALASLAGAAALGSVVAFRRLREEEEVDFVVIGAGSSGCAVAARLSEGLPGLRVLLLEAGEDDDVPEIQTAVDYFGKVDRVFTSDRDWGHGTEFEQGLGGRGLYWPRGKVVGGCSSFNTMVWMRPESYDLDHWAELTGDESWSYKGMLPHFRRAETHPLAESNPEIHGKEGPIAVARLDHAQHGAAAHKVTHTFVAAAQSAASIPRNEDFGAGLQGVGINDVNAAGGRRCNAAQYLRRAGACPSSGAKRARRGNLEVRLLSQATRVTFDEQPDTGAPGGSAARATGVEICEDAHQEGKRRRRIRARREVVLCGGVVNSPQLLLLSGIGPKAQLASLGIPVVADVPGVGEALQDHLHVAMSYRLDSGVKPHPQSNICEGSLFTRFEPGSGASDLQVHCGTVFFEPDGFYPSGEGFTLTPTLIHTRSTGVLRLRSTDPFEKPEIIANYFSDEADIPQLRRGVRLCRKIGDEMLRRLGGEEVYPGPSVQTDPEVDQYIKRYANTVYHPACTCRAGRLDDPMAVLDPDFRVRGVSGLRVVDASAMPSHVGCNTNATCVALGEKAAELLVRQHRQT